MFSTSDTIVAVATPPGRGGLGVIRISGSEAPRIARELFAGGAALLPRRATVVRIVAGPETDIPGSAVDEVVATWFKAPHSYTRDDVVEIGAHGSPVVLEGIVALAVRAGARLAEPGEFTLRAYLNGRIDLVQAEAVADLIEAVTPAQARAAMDQLEGTLTSRIAEAESRLFDLAARLEASIDFPEEGFHFVTRNNTAGELDSIDQSLARLTADGASGRLIREGAMVVILGRPNAGKSSLFNALAGAERAIVTDVAGTTRDAVTERIDIEGVPITLVDTAGVREARDVVEAEGIRRTHAAASVAAVLLVVVDGSRPWTSDDRELARGGGRRILVRNKTDLPSAWPADALTTVGHAIDVSALSGAGISELRRRIVRELNAGEPIRDTPAISNVRHLGLVARAREAIGRARTVAAGDGVEEVVLAELTLARRALEELTGQKSDEDLLRHIFSRFCIGK